MAGMFDDPGEGGDRIEWKHYKGCLLLIFPKKLREGVHTKFTRANGNDPKEAVQADIVVLTNPKGEKLAEPMRKNNTLIFPGFLVGALRDSVGRMVLGVLGQKPTDKGNDAWILTKATDEQKALAADYVANVSNEAQASADATAGDTEADPFAPE